MTPRRPSLHRRLSAGFGAVAAAFAIFSLAAILSLDRLGSAISTILRENYDSVALAVEMNDALERQGAAALLAVTGRRDVAAPMLAEHRARFETALVKEESNVTVAGEGELVREIRAQWDDYRREVDRAVAAAPAAPEAYFRDLLPRFERLKASVDRVRALNQAQMERADRDAKRLARWTLRGALLGSVIAVLFFAWFARRLTRSIMLPIATLTSSAKAIGEGDLDVAVPEPDADELATLARAWNRMAEQLRLYRESSLGELLAAKDLARATLEGMLDPVVVLDRDGGVLLANEAAEAAFGVRIGSADELREAGVALPEDLCRARDQALASGAPVLPKSLAEAARRRVDGGDRYYLVRALPLGSGPRDRPRALIVAQDVTRFRRIDELKTDMVATVSHEFKTPLTSLRMATHMLLEPSSGELTEAQRELVTTARDDTERLRAMVEDLLDVVRIETEAGALHRVPIEPSGLLYEVADAHRAIARDKGVTIEVEPGAHGRVTVDPERLSIALANLVANAVRHTPSGGRVRLRARQEDGALSIHVADDGEGVPPELLSRVFDRSFTTSARGEGHGLGLAIAREIVLQHGGELTVDSGAGRGSVFSLVIPSAAG